MRDRPKSFVLLLCVATGAAACGQDGPRGDPLKGGEPPVTKSPGRLPEGHPPIPQGLPEGHPPVDGPGAPPPAPMQRKAAAPAATPFAWTTPSGWTETPPATSMRLAQFELPAKWPDGVPIVCAVFGAIGGGRQANVDRWISQFRQKDGSDSKSKAQVTESQRDGLSVTRVELTGMFSDGMVQPPREAGDGLLLGGIVETADGESVFVKLTGPRELVAAQAASFDALLASIRKKP